MNTRWAIVLGIIGGCALAWWLYHTPDKQSAQKPTTTQQQSRFYRWVDKDGVTQISSTPPEKGQYQIIEIDPERNILPSVVDTEEDNPPEKQD